MRVFSGLMIAAFLVVRLATADPVPLTTAHGKVVKVTKDSLAFQPREATGKFGKTVTLRLTGTSKITTLAPQTRAKKLVLTQKDTDPQDLKPGQGIAVIYAEPEGTEPILLSAVAEAAAAK